VSVDWRDEHQMYVAQSVHSLLDPGGFRHDPITPADDAWLSPGLRAGLVLVEAAWRAATEQRSATYEQRRATCTHTGARLACYDDDCRVCWWCNTHLPVGAAPAQQGR